ncbi:DNA polymerase III subunit delta' [Thermovibrio sp.]
MLFSSVVGHSKQLGIIRELVEKGLFPSTTLFCGPEGVGKRLIGRELLTYLTGSPFSVREIGLEKPPTIEEIRELTEWLFTKPTEGKGKGALIDNAELMRSEAANALLKTLEEPPDYAYLILIARNEEGVLPTIRSRCRVFRFGRLSDANVEYVLERLGIDYDKRAIKVSRGSPGVALKIAENPTVLELLSDFVNLMKSKNRLKEITAFSSKFSNLSREETLLFLDSLEALLSQKETILKWADKIEEARRFLRFYGKPQSVIEWLLIEKLTF